MIQDRESAGYLLGETARLLRLNAGNVFMAMVVMTVLGVPIDLFPDFVGLTLLGISIVSLVFQYALTRATLSHYQLIDGGAAPRRLWALFGLSLISGIGIFIGTLLLIIPGAYLLVRWSAAVPALIAEDAGISGSLERSAAAVRGRFWHVFAALLVIWTPCVAAVLAAMAVLPEDQNLVTSLALDLALNLTLIAGWHLAVAIYAGRQDGRNLAEVFA